MLKSSLSAVSSTLRRVRSDTSSGRVNARDTVEIDIPNRSIRLAVTDEELAKRRAEMEARGAKAWKPVNRERHVSAALRAYAAMTTSADTGAVRDVSQVE